MNVYLVEKFGLEVKRPYFLKNTETIYDYIEIAQFEISVGYLRLETRNQNILNNGYNHIEFELTTAFKELAKDVTGGTYVGVLLDFIKQDMGIALVDSLYGISFHQRIFVNLEKDEVGTVYTLE
jgi:hypothetical protein